MTQATTSPRRLRLKPISRLSQFDQGVLNQLHNQSCILEKHELKIAKHTGVQTWIAFFQLIFGIITTGLLIYVAVLQFQAADRQAGLADRQVKLEYAKVSPQFSARLTSLQLHAKSVNGTPFPNELAIRILRGEASLEEVDAVQEIEISRLVDGKVNQTCTLRISNYFIPKQGNITDFSVSPLMKRLSEKPNWFQDSGLHDFVLASAQTTLVSIEFRDVFGDEKTSRFEGSSNTLSQIPSGGFSNSSIYETVDVHVNSDAAMRIPSSFVMNAGKPKTAACRAIVSPKS